MKILNLYAGIGGNRKLWGDSHEITAVEIDANIATVYKDLYPKDAMVIGDAHEYLMNHYNEYDFIWSSPPCPTHSKIRYMHKNKIYPDLKIYEEIIFLKSWFNGNYIVENVIPYYEPLIQPTTVLHRHAIWSNFKISHMEFEKLKTCKVTKEKEFLEEKFNYDLSKYSGIDKRKVLRNCVVPEMGLHILLQLLKTTETVN